MRETRCWRIENAEGQRVTARRTLRECRELLEKYVTEPPSFPGWSEGPYTIVRIIKRHVTTFRPRATPSGGDPHVR